MRDNVPSLLTTRGPMWSSLTVLPPVDMSIFVVLASFEGSGRGNGVSDEFGWFEDAIVRSMEAVRRVGAIGRERKRCVL
jgi:hypothetical protein